MTRPWWPRISALSALAAAATTVPTWWRATPDGRAAIDSDLWSGTELVGVPVTTVLWVLGVAAVVVAAVTRRWAALPAGIGGVLAVASAATVLDAWGPQQPWPLVMPALGALAAVTAAATAPRGTPRIAAGAAAALGAVVLVGTLPDAVPQPVALTDGPYVRLAAVDPTLDPRSGTATLPGFFYRGGLAVVDGAPVVVSGEAVAGVDAAGRSVVLAVGDGDIVAATGDRVVVSDGEPIVIAPLRDDGPPPVTVPARTTDIPIGPDGSLLVRVPGDPGGVAGVLDVATVTGPVDAAALPRRTTTAGSSALQPVAGGALSWEYRDETLVLRRRDTIGVADLAGGPDARCGLSPDPTRAYLTGVGDGPVYSPVTTDDTGGIWFAEDRTLLRLGPDGVLRAVDHPLPGTPFALAALPDGGLALALGGDPAGLWMLPDAAAAAVDLPVPAECGTARRAPGPVAGLVPVGTAGDTDVPLDLTGRVAVVSGGAVSLRDPDGRGVPLGTVTGELNALVPDGSGGVWWASTGPDDAVELVHVRAGVAPERVPVDVPYVTTLVPDLGGGPPLLGTADGVFRATPGGPVRVAEGYARAGVVRADGLAVLVVDGRVVEVGPDGVVREVVDGRGGDPRDPVDVQLARGVTPGRLLLGSDGVHARVTVAADEAGDVLVVADRVVLRVRDGVVTPVAELGGPGTETAVVGGLVWRDLDGGLSRIDLPA